MFQPLGQIIATRWLAVALGWLLVWGAGMALAPPWSLLVRDYEYGFLPRQSESQIGEEKLRVAFPRDIFNSSVILLVRRPSRPGGLIRPEEAALPEKSDYYFIDEILKPRILQLAEEDGGLAEGGTAPDDRRSIISAVRTPSDAGFQNILRSEDSQATLVMVELTTFYTENRTAPVVARLDRLLDDLRQERKLPMGLDIQLSGTATLGRDQQQLAAVSARRVAAWSTLTVIVLLFWIYRAPALALAPLVTVFIAVQTSLSWLSVLAGWEVIKLTPNINVYIQVLVYGIGVNLCLILIDRYREQIRLGQTIEEAIRNTLTRVGAPIAASAGTVIFAVGMLTFARFGQFQEAGLAIACSLAVCLLAVLTLTPALLRLAARWAFWPQMHSELVGRSSGWVIRGNPILQFLTFHWFGDVWRRLAEYVSRRPTWVWLWCVGLMSPLAALGIYSQSQQAYSPLADYPPRTPVVQGTQAIQEHFPAGATGPTTVLIEHPQVDFTRVDATELIERLTEAILREGEPYGVVDVRSLAYPLGRRDQPLSKLTGISLPRRKVIYSRTVHYYVSSAGPLQNHATRLDVIFRDDPFNRKSIHGLEEFEVRLRELVNEIMPREMQPLVLIQQYARERNKTLDDLVQGVERQPEFNRLRVRFTELMNESQLTSLQARLEATPGIGSVRIPREKNAGPELILTPAESHYFSVQTAGEELYRSSWKMWLTGVTPSIRDLKAVTDSDRWRIDLLILFGIYAILFALLRRPVLSAYLLLTVVFSYLVALGLTHAAWRLWLGDDFTGLDWKVSLLLFAVLIAVGANYNIILLSRLEEEQRQAAPLQGIIRAVEKTGGIISACGLLLAATFLCLLTATVVSTEQLGFALAIGTLLDTFIVRPLLVPAWLVFFDARRDQSRPRET